jgi:hypothetical protein
MKHWHYFQIKHGRPFLSLALMKSNKIMSKRLKSYCSITPDYQTVDDLADWDEQLEFIKAFRDALQRPATNLH